MGRLATFLGSETTHLVPSFSLKSLWKSAQANRTKCHTLGDLSDQISFLTVLEAESLRSGSSQSLNEASLGLHTGPCLPSWLSYLYGVSFFFFFLRSDLCVPRLALNSWIQVILLPSLSTTGMHHNP